MVIASRPETSRVRRHAPGAFFDLRFFGNSTGRVYRFFIERKEAFAFTSVEPEWRRCPLEVRKIMK
jgi:hypothetical protein